MGMCAEINAVVDSIFSVIDLILLFECDSFNTCNISPLNDNHVMPVIDITHVINLRHYFESG